MKRSELRALIEGAKEQGCAYLVMWRDLEYPRLTKTCAAPDAKYLADFTTKLASGTLTIEYNEILDLSEDADILVNRQSRFIQED